MDNVRQQEVFGMMSVVYIYELAHAFQGVPGWISPEKVLQNLQFGV